MTTAELIEKIRDALAGSAALQTWCSSKFGKGPTVYIGMNEDQPAPAEDYPIIAITDVTEIRGNTQNIKTWEVGIGCGIISDTLTTSNILDPAWEDDPENPDDVAPILATKKSHTGMLDVETFREMVEDILKAERFAKLTWNGESGPLNMYPVFVSYSVVTVEVIESRRRS